MERRWKVLVLVSVGMFMAFLDAPVVSVAFPAIQNSFPDSVPATVAWTLDAYFVGFASFLVVAGRAADRYGRRNLFMIGLPLFVAASLACGAAPGIGVLIGCRAIQAIAAAIVVPSGQALMLSEFPADEQKKAIGVLAGVIGLATALAPAAGGLVVEWLDWRWIFWLSAFVALLAWMWASRLLARESPSSSHGRMPDVVGAIVQGGGLGLIVLAILKSPDWGIGSARTLGVFGLGCALLLFFFWRCARHPAPVLDLSLFRDRTFAVASLSSIGLGVGLFGGSLATVLYFTQVWHWSTLAAGCGFIPGGLVAALVGKPAGDLAQRYGPRIVGAAGSAVAGVGVLLIAFQTTGQSEFASDFLPGQIVYSAGIVTGMSALLGAALTSVRPTQYAVASGINNALRQVGGAIAVAVVVAIMGDVSGESGVGRGHGAFVFAGAALLVSGALALLMPSRRSGTSPRTHPRLEARKTQAAEPRIGGYTE